MRVAAGDSRSNAAFVNIDPLFAPTPIGTGPLTLPLIGQTENEDLEDGYDNVYV
jgi:hypothetical protein